MKAILTAEHSTAPGASPGMTRREYCLKTICWPDRSAAFQNTSSSRWRERWWPLPYQ